MNLALKDIRSSRQRFILTILGVGAILTATLGINGLYRGIVHEALLIVSDIGADLWIVQGGRAGPFAEASYVSNMLDRRAEGLHGVKQARRFVQFNKHFEVHGRPTRIAVTGLDYPKDIGDWVPLIAGRHLAANRQEAVADKSLGLVVGDTLRLFREEYKIVGLTAGQVDTSGDGLLFVTVADAIDLEANAPSEAILLGRAASEGAGRGPRSVAAVIVELAPGADAEAIRRNVLAWGDVDVMTRADQFDLMLNGRLWRLRLQILAFVITMLAVTAVVIAMTIYNVTLEKTRSIALLKLMGASDRFISNMILQNSLIIGVASYAIAIAISLVIYPHFPRTVLIQPGDAAVFFVATLVICAISSLVGVRKARQIRAQDVLA